MQAVQSYQIFWTVRKSSSAVSTLVGEQQKLRRKRDIRYAFQFCFLLVFYVFVWVLFRVLPVLLANKHVEWFILVPTLYTFNCSSNAIIYLCFNSEVQSNLFPRRFLSVLEYMGLDRSGTPTHQRSIASFTNQSRVHSIGQTYQIAIRFIPERKHQPFRSIGLISHNNRISN
uniref:G_PROTEIN_RECEP_F1_2 domain-containing protein n=1 Tax=Caenorhabditis tropicalis TaxID=1561998 RepID=A0A1I7UK99_9PELO